MGVPTAALRRPARAAFSGLLLALACAVFAAGALGRPDAGGATAALDAGPKPRDAGRDATEAAAPAPSASADLELPLEMPTPSAAPEPSAAAEPAPLPSASAPPPSATPSSTAPSGAASAASPAPSASAGADVRVGDASVFQIRVPHGKTSAKARAEAAEAALKDAAKNEKPDEVRVEARGDAFIVYAGKTPIVELWAEDAAAAGAPELREHAERVAERVRDAIRSEQKRSAIATTVFSLSLVVLALLFGIYLLRKIAEFSERTRDWVLTHPERIPTLRIYSLEVVRPAALRSGLLVSFGAGRWILQLTVVYLWVLGSLSLFESTRHYTEKLTSLVVSPITGLLGRLVATIPMLVVTVLATLAVIVCLRFVGMFMSSVARGETRVGWLSAERAEPTSILLRAGIAAAALVFLAPVVTGDSEGALARAGTVMVAAFGLGATPLVASALAGAAVLYSRKLEIGARVQVGSAAGTVVSIGLFAVMLRADDGAELRVPHLLLLVRESRVLQDQRATSVLLAISPAHKPGEVTPVLEKAAGLVGDKPSVELVRADVDGIVFRVTAETEPPRDPTRLYGALLDALGDHGIRLGRDRSSGAP